VKLPEMLCSRAKSANSQGADVGADHEQGAGITHFRCMIVGGENEIGGNCHDFPRQQKNPGRTRHGDEEHG
jgi:hypothetical protein